MKLVLNTQETNHFYWQWFHILKNILIYIYLHSVRSLLWYATTLATLIHIVHIKNLWMNFSMKKLVHLSQIEKKFHIYWTYAKYWIFISIRPGQTGLCQSNPHSYMPLSLCDVSVLLHGIITSNTAEAFFLYFCCKAIRVQTEESYDLIGPRQYQRRKRYGILNFKNHTTHYTANVYRQTTVR